MKKFLAELRRRKVLRVAAIYVATAFGVLEAADILQGSMRLPASFVPSVTVLVILGVPLALALGWLFDLTSGGIRRTAPFERAGEQHAVPGSAIWPTAALSVVAALALGAASWTVAGIRDVGSSTSSALNAGPAGAEPDGGEAQADFASIAVLPFINLGGDASDDYFGDGLAEELANVLSRIAGLRVAARTSAFAFKDSSIDAKRIADTLGVSTLLEGSVRRAGDRVRIGVQLVRAADGLSLWSNSWDRELTTANVFAIQDEITGAIATALERELVTGTGRSVEDRRTADIDAYDLYLLGRFQWALRTPAGLAQAIRHFEQAIALDSTFALAWAGLADAWEATPFFDDDVSASAALPNARRAAQRALELAPQLAEAQAATGVILSDYDYDYSAAIERFERSLELNPNYAQAWSWLCVAHTMAGNPEAGLGACDRAIRLDPLSAVPHAQRALALMSLGRYAEALGALEHADALGPLAWVLSVAMRLELGRGDEIDEALIRTGAALGLPDPEAMRLVAREIRGELEASPGTALAVLKRLEAAGSIGFLELAPLYSWTGNRDEALQVFRAAVREGDPWLPFAGQVTSFDALRDDPGFAEALDTLGILNGGAAYRAARGGSP